MDNSLPKPKKQTGQSGALFRNGERSHWIILRMSPAEPQSLVELVSRYLPLTANGGEAHGRCVFCSDERPDGLKVGDTAWRTVCCCQNEVDGSDAAGFLMSWSGCTREEAEHQLSNGNLPEPMPVQVQPRRQVCFWTVKELVDRPKEAYPIVWIHWAVEGVHFGREHLAEGRVHLGLCQGRPIDDDSIKRLDGRSCILLPDNRESSFERMDELASKLYAAGHAKVRYVRVQDQPSEWAFPGQLSPTDALAFVQSNVSPYPNNAPTSGSTPAVSASGPEEGAPIAAPQDNKADTASQGAGLVAPSSGSLPNTSGPAGAAPDSPKRARKAQSPPASGPTGGDQPSGDHTGRGNGSTRLTPPERAAAYAEQARTDVLDQLVYTCIADVKPEAVKWLWPGRIPLGELTMIVGDPGLGKSQICCSLASVVTNGGQWPVDRNHAEVGSVLILSAEDNIKHTIRPRLDAAGANVSRCHTLQAVKRNTELGIPYEASFNLAEDLAKLSVLIKELKDVRMVIIDPVSAYLGETDSHKNAEVRGMLAPLTTLAGNHNTAIILVSHLTKSQSANALMRVQGSIAFAALCRAVWGVTADKEDRARRLFMPLKNNLGQDKTGLAYAIEGMEIENRIPTSRVMWESQPVETTIDEAFGAALSHEERSEIDDVKEFLREVLATGRVKASEVQRAARAAGHSHTTLGRAKRLMRIISEPEGFGTGRVWYWRLALEEPPLDQRSWVPDN